MEFISISKEQFDAYFYGRTPYVKLFTNELDWFVYEAEGVTLLAVMLFCKIDNDFNAVILGRDLDNKFRAIDIVVSINSRDGLVSELNTHIDKLVKSHVDGKFFQGDENTKPFSIFNTLVSKEKRNHYFGLLKDDPMYFPAKVMLEELAHWFKDPDGIYIKGFQGNEFNARLFEIYLHAVFYELDFEMNRDFAQPDYTLTKEGETICIEATTVAQLQDPDENKGKPYDLDSILRYVDEEMPFKFARSLLNKVRYRPKPLELPYWELEHTKNNPFIIALHDYSKPMSMTYSSSAMQSYLYGINIDDKGVAHKIDFHKTGNRTIKSNFFEHEGNKYVSAVMLPTGATLPKFNRMGRIAGLRSPNSFAIITGARSDAEGNIKPFRQIVEDPKYKEFWHEGIYMFHNPNAVHPLNFELFPHVIHVFKDEETENLKQYIPPNYIVSSVTNMMKFDPANSEKTWKAINEYLKKNDQTE